MRTAVTKHVARFWESCTSVYHTTWCRSISVAKDESLSMTQRVLRIAQRSLVPLMPEFVAWSKRDSTDLHDDEEALSMRIRVSTLYD